MSLAKATLFSLARSFVVMLCAAVGWVFGQLQHPHHPGGLQLDPVSGLLMFAFGIFFFGGGMLWTAADWIATFLSHSGNLTVRRFHHPVWVALSAGVAIAYFIAAFKMSLRS